MWTRFWGGAGHYFKVSMLLRIGELSLGLPYTPVTTLPVDILRWASAQRAGTKDRSGMPPTYPRGELRRCLFRVIGALARECIQIRQVG